MPNIPYVQSVNRDYREALDSVFEVLSDKISRPSVQNHDPEDCSELYPDQSKSSPMSLPISFRLRSSFKMADAYLSDLHSRSSNVGASQTKLRKLGIFPNKPSKLSFARYKPMASDVWSDLLKDPDQGSGLPSPKKEIYLSRNIAHALEKSLRSDLMILNSLDFFREALSVNHTNLVKLVDQSESNLSLDIQQALDVNSLLINQVKFHFIDLLASITHSISTVTLARRDSFLSTVPKHVPDHIVRELRSHPIYGPSLFGESALKALYSHTKEYKQEQFQSVLTKGVSNNFLLLHPGASLSKDNNPKIGIFKIGKFRRVLLLVLVPFKVPINHVVESLPGVGAKSPNRNLNNDVLQEVRVPFGLATAPREFTTLVKEVKRMALRLGISVHKYLDDWLIKVNSCQEAHSATLTLLELTHKRGWIVNREKSDLLPKQVFTFLGQVFNLSKGVCYPTEARFLSIQEAIHPLLFNPHTTPRQVMHLLGLLASTEKLVPQGRLHM